MTVYGVKQETNFKTEEYLLDPLFMNREDAKKFAERYANRLIRVGEHIRTFDNEYGNFGVIVIAADDSYGAGYERELYTIISLEVVE